MRRDDTHWCELGFAEQATVFKGPTRNARVLSEAWVAAQMFCPNCGADRLRALHNHPPPPAIVIPGGGERSEPEARNPAARESAKLSGAAVRGQIAFGVAGFRPSPE